MNNAFVIEVFAYQCLVFFRINQFISLLCTVYSNFQSPLKKFGYHYSLPCHGEIKLIIRLTYQKVKKPC